MVVDLRWRRPEDGHCLVGVWHIERGTAAGDTVIGGAASPLGSIVSAILSVRNMRGSFSL